MKNMILIVPATMQETDMTDRPAIKPLEWSGDYAHTGLGLMYHIEETEDERCVILERIEGSSVIKSAHIDRPEARACAQTHFESRLRSCLIDKPEAGEAVAWMYRLKGLSKWHFYEGDTFDLPEPDAYEYRPLYASSSPLSAGDAGEIERLRSALEEAEEVLQLVEHPAFPDPQYHEQVKALGTQIGYGALMSTASAAWREFLAANGYPIGSEFVAGPCHGTVVATLQKIRSALSAWRKREK